MTLKKMKAKKKITEESRIAYFGTPDFSTFVLEELEKARIVPSLIVTAPDKPAGRGMEMQSSAVKAWADEKGIPAIQPERLDGTDAEADILFNGEWDLCIVAAYGKILPRAVLDLPHYGTLNVHPSLLPKFRGPSPIESQILADEREVGVSIIVLDEEMDHGPVVAQASITPEPWPFRRSELENLLWHSGGELLDEVIPTWILESSGHNDNGENPDSIIPEPQDHLKATYTPKLKKEDGLIDLAGDGYKNYLKFCAYEGWPGTYFFAKKNGKEVRVKIADAKYENDAFIPTRVIPEGKQEMAYEDLVRSFS